MSKNRNVWGRQTRRWKKRGRVSKERWYPRGRGVYRTGDVRVRTSTEPKDVVRYCTLQHTYGCPLGRPYTQMYRLWLGWRSKVMISQWTSIGSRDQGCRHMYVVDRGWGSGGPCIEVDKERQLEYVWPSGLGTSVWPYMSTRDVGVYTFEVRGHRWWQSGTGNDDFGLRDDSWDCRKNEWHLGDVKNSYSQKTTTAVPVERLDYSEMWWGCVLGFDEIRGCKL